MKSGGAGAFRCIKVTVLLVQLISDTVRRRNKILKRAEAHFLAGGKFIIDIKSHPLNILSCSELKLFWRDKSCTYILSLFFRPSTCGYYHHYRYTHPAIHSTWTIYWFPSLLSQFIFPTTKLFQSARFLCCALCIFPLQWVGVCVAYPEATFILKLYSRRTGSA